MLLFLCIRFDTCKFVHFGLYLLNGAPPLACQRPRTPNTTRLWMLCTSALPKFMKFLSMPIRMAAYQHCQRCLGHIPQLNVWLCTAIVVQCPCGIGVTEAVPRTYGPWPGGLCAVTPVMAQGPEACEPSHPCGSR